MHEETRRQLAGSFQHFARRCAEQDSPFYQRLATFVATNDQLLKIAAHTAREPVPNAFFGAVHYLLLDGSPHQLREYYPSMVERPRVDEEVFKSLVDFCLRSRDPLIGLLKTRLVQTNEINRCAILAPAFGVVYQAEGRLPLVLVEIGASAGLNLLWDRYRIDYSDGSVLGDPQSSVHVHCENRGTAIATELRSRPNIASRMGIDLHPMDLGDKADRLWLRALVWPDHGQRASRLEAAMAMARQCPMDLVRGNALDELPRILSTAAEGTLCVYHSSVLYQFTSNERDQLTSQLSAASAARPIWQVWAESEEGLRLFSYRRGSLVDQQFLGSFDSHGRWLCWE